MLEKSPLSYCGSGDFFCETGENNFVNFSKRGNATGVLTGMPLEILFFRRDMATLIIKKTKIIFSKIFLFVIIKLIQKNLSDKFLTSKGL
jgi:hypothetical protein